MTRFRCAIMNTGRIAHHRLAPTKRAAPRLCNIQLVPQRRKLAANRFGNQLFNIDIAALESTLRKASALQRFLNIEPIVCNVGDKLGMSLRLVESTHNSKANPDAIFLHETRD